MKARYIQEVGTRGSLRVYWDNYEVTAVESCGQCPEGHPTRVSLNSCPNCLGGGKPGYHNAEFLLKIIPEKDAWKAFGEIEDYKREQWPTKCDHCGEPVPQDDRPNALGGRGAGVNYQVFTTRAYNTQSSKPEPGDIYETDFHEPDHCPYWSNCSGIHRYAILPNGDHWDLDSRASNCTMRDDRMHRCWVAHGSIKDGTINVDKNGFTCAAGAGSIAADGWHGFLRNGEFVC